MFKIFLTTLVLTVLTFAYGPVLRTGQVKSYNTDGWVMFPPNMDDGRYQMGKIRSYSRRGNVVNDDTTGLKWQDNETVSKTWEEAITYCEDLSFDGDGWRLPTIEELETLVDYSRSYPSVTAVVFQNFSSYPYWSSTEKANFDSYAWIVSFYDGDSNYKSKVVEPYYVRCVRDGHLTPSSFSRNNATGIVTDSATGLQWQDNEIVEITTEGWQGAIDYCENDLMLGGHSDWRLPNENELLSIANRLRYHPAINITYFLNTALSNYWSSTTLASYTGYAWIVNFNHGRSNYISKTIDNYYVRCVRGGQHYDINIFLNPSVYLLLLD